MLNLKKLEVKLDEALTGETTESLTEWMNEKVMEQINNNRLIKLEQLAALLQSVWHYGEFKAETVNEREMETIMRELGYWPVTMSAATWELNLKLSQLNGGENNMGEMNNNNPGNNNTVGNLIEEHLIIRETVGYEFINNIAIEDIPEVIKFLKVIHNYNKMNRLNK